jgi:hypothetical protein
LHTIYEDAPAEVKAYAASQNLLSNPVWAEIFNARPPQPAPLPNDDVDDVIFDAQFEPLTYDETKQKALNAARRYNRLKGVNGETCYVLIVDRKSGAMQVSIRRDKTPPLDFFAHWIAKHASTAPNRVVRFDRGGELGHCEEVHELFSKAGYDVQFTASRSSSEIGLVERYHRTIGDAVRTMLFAAALPMKYWPYALKYHVFISNCLVHGDRKAAAITICTGRRPNLSLLRVFGCRIYALPSTDRDGKADVHARSGVFLGYDKTMRNAIYVDSETGEIKVARHVAFDEGMNDSKKPPPYVQYLRDDLAPEEVHLDDIDDDMKIVMSPFTTVDSVACVFRPNAAQPLGFQVERCPQFLRAYASAFTSPFGRFDVSQANKRYLGGYIIQIGDKPVFSPDDVASAIKSYAAQDLPPKTLTVLIAKDLRKGLSDSRPPPPHSPSCRHPSCRCHDSCRRGGHTSTTTCLPSRFCSHSCSWRHST